MQCFPHAGQEFGWYRLWVINDARDNARVFVANKEIDLRNGSWQAFEVPAEVEGEAPGHVAIGRDGMENPVLSYRVRCRNDDGDDVTMEVTVTIVREHGACGFRVQGPYRVTPLDCRLLLFILAAVSVATAIGMLLALLAG